MGRPVDRRRAIVGGAAAVALAGPGTIRPDGRKLNPMYLFRVKAPGESRAPWDYYERLDTIPLEQAFGPLDAGSCPIRRT